MTVSTQGSVLITGASSGIGKTCALMLDRSGYRVFAGVRKIEAGEALKKESSGNLVPVILDITDQNQIAAAVKTVEGLLGTESGLSGLVNNAGIGVVGPMEFIPLDHLREQIDVNFIGHVAVTQAFMPLIRKGCGRVINIGSGSGRIALPFLGPYAAAKYALEAVTDALRRELQPWGIPVVIIEPGAVKTPIFEKGELGAEKILSEMPVQARDYYSKRFHISEKIAMKAVKRAIKPEVVARVVLEALRARRPRTRYAVGPDAAMAVIGSFLPDRFIDWCLVRVRRSMGGE